MTETVALLVVDAARRDVFEECAPKLSSRAAMVADRCVAPSSWTPASHGSMLTGLLPSEHGVNANGIDFADVRGRTLLDEWPGTTIGVSANGFLTPDFGFDTLFDEFLHFHGSEELVPGGVDTRQFTGKGPTALLRSALAQGNLAASLLNGAYVKLNDVLLDTSLPRLGDYGASGLIRSAKRMTTDGSFLFMNFVDVHGPHENLRRYGNTGVPNTWTSREQSVWEVNADPNPGYLENYRTLYRRSVSYVDDKLAPFVDWLVSEFDATVIVTADHGEGLGPPDDEVFGHKRVSQSVLDVPFLLVNPPETADLGTVSLLDLPQVVRWILGEGSLPTREVFPAERLGDPDAPSPEWNRVERAVYSPEGWFAWDETTEGTVPAAYRDQFPGPIGALSSPAGKLRVDADVERRLHDLGYK